MSDILSDAREWLRENPVGERMGRAHDSECHRRHLECLVSRMAAEIERLREERRWISVEERVPETGEEVIVCVDGHRGPAWSNRYQLVAFRGAVSEQWLQERHESAKPVVGVTHWMPLPAPPEEK